MPWHEEDVLYSASVSLRFRHRKTEKISLDDETEKKSRAGLIFEILSGFTFKQYFKEKY